jgi:response regulator NasT
MSSLRVLICEDEGLTTLRLRTTLTRLGHEVVGVAGDGEAVIPAAAELQPDLILMDVEMPRLDGISATRRIMSESPTAIVISSAYSDRETVQSALEAGASGYLVKPVSDEQLERALCAAMECFESVALPPTFSRG